MYLVLGFFFFFFLLFIIFFCHLLLFLFCCFFVVFLFCVFLGEGVVGRVLSNFLFNNLFRKIGSYFDETTTLYTFNSLTTVFVRKEPKH